MTNRLRKRYEGELRRYARDFNASVVGSLRAKTLHLAEDPTHGSSSVLAAELFGVAVDEQVRGELAVLDGDTRGWARMALALSYGVYVARFCSQIAGPLETAVWLLLALAFDDRAAAAELGALMLRSLRDDPSAAPGTGILGAWDTSPVPPFALTLWFMAQRDSEPAFDERLVAPLEGYELVPALWEDGDRFEDALLSVCDMHVAHSTDKTFGAFRRGYRLMVPEVHAIRRVRRRLGLPTPVVDHPVLDNPVAASSEPAPVLAAQDDALLRVLASRWKAMSEASR
jgi:hypothetical protein